MSHWTITARLAAFGLGMSLVAAMPNALPAGRGSGDSQLRRRPHRQLQLHAVDSGRGTRHDGDLNQCRRQPALGTREGREVQICRTRHRRQLLANLHGTG